MTPDGPIVRTLDRWTELVANAYAAEVVALGLPVTEYEWAPHAHLSGSFLMIDSPYTLPGAPMCQGAAGVPDGTWWALVDGTCNTVKVLDGMVVWQIPDKSVSPVDLYEMHIRRIGRYL